MSAQPARTPMRCRRFRRAVRTSARISAYDPLRTFARRRTAHRPWLYLALRSLARVGKKPSMCNRFRLSAKEAELARKFGAEISPERGKLPPPELFPKRPAYVVREENGSRILDVMSWGFPSLRLAVRQAVIVLSAPTSIESHL